jgi:hypothetical protein
MRKDQFRGDAEQLPESEDQIVLIPLKRGKPTGPLPLAIEEVSSSRQLVTEGEHGPSSMGAYPEDSKFYYPRSK